MKTVAAEQLTTDQSSSYTGLEPIDPRALYSRRDASPYLGGISVATMIRMERAGILKPVKPSRSRLGTTYYEGSNLIAVRGGMDQ